MTGVGGISLTNETAQVKAGFEEGHCSCARGRSFSLLFFFFFLCSDSLRFQPSCVKPLGSVRLLARRFRGAKHLVLECWSKTSGLWSRTATGLSRRRPVGRWQTCRRSEHAAVDKHGGKPARTRAYGLDSPTSWTHSDTHTSGNSPVISLAILLANRGIQN